MRSSFLLHRDLADEVLVLRLVKTKRQDLEFLRGRAPVGVDRRRDGRGAGERSLVRGEVVGEDLERAESLLAQVLLRTVARRDILRNKPYSNSAPYPLSSGPDSRQWD